MDKIKDYDDEGEYLQIYLNIVINSDLCQSILLLFFSVNVHYKVCLYIV